MKYLVTLCGKDYEIEVEQGEASMVSVRDTVATSEAPVAEVSAPTASSTVPESGKRIDAPLPGLVVDIKVSQGTAVKKGDVLVILETMKMESSIVSPQDGIVGSIACAKGETVEMGDLLVSLL